MKRKFSMIVVLFCLSMPGFSQSAVVIQTTENKSESNDGTYWINGISSKEDIGGVEVEKVTYNWEEVLLTGGKSIAKRDKIVVKNYNTSMVTVYYEIHTTHKKIWDDPTERSLKGSAVLPPNGSKELFTDLPLCESFEVHTITRKLQ